ncbi:hypothetical protein GCM10015535_31620 [Streptomyces gelaticus]|uniref:Uncharacterized protein n=1 Tax=Streptomyces gelaticus TaxID=285446 RepID=A0ABQ2VYJ2_9ACTN|nr:hypothetical protein GCM10015535_31620 [Streptomyces gelaticus]
MPPGAGAPTGAAPPGVGAGPAARGRCAAAGSPGRVLPSPDDDDGDGDGDGDGAPDPGCWTSRRQVAATTGRAVLPAVGAEKPSPEPVLTFRDLPASRARDRWTTGAVGPPPPAAGPACPFSRSGVILRTRTGATGAEAEGAEATATTGVPAREASTTRWTAAGRAAGSPGGAGTAEERTGISEGVGAGFGMAGAEGAGVPGSPVGIAPCWEFAAPDRGVRRRSPSKGASFRSLAVDGSEGRGVPIPPRARAGEPEPDLSGCGGG